MRFIALLGLFCFFNVKAAMIDAVYLHGIVLSSFSYDKYVSVRDSFDQEYVLPKSLVEKKTGRKIASSGRRDYRGFIYFFEVSSKEYASIQDSCMHDDHLIKTKKVKFCPPKL